MLNPIFISFEILELLLFILCLRHALRHKDNSFHQLMAGVAYGLLLELISIYIGQGYSYPKFTLMALNVPLVIGIAWGNQLYAMRLFSDTTDLPEWCRPISDALLIVFIDLLVDPVAIRLGMWQWRGLTMQDQFFGVPYANFWGFFWLVYSFSRILRWLERQPSPWARWLGPSSAVVGGLVTLNLLTLLVRYTLPPGSLVVATPILLLGALAIALSQRPRFARDPSLPSSAVLLLSQAYFLTAGLVTGTIIRPPSLLIISMAILATSYVLFRGSDIRPTHAALE